MLGADLSADPDRHRHDPADHLHLLAQFRRRGLSAADPVVARQAPADGFADVAGVRCAADDQRYVSVSADYMGATVCAFGTGGGAVLDDADLGVLDRLGRDAA